MKPFAADGSASAPRRIDRIRRRLVWALLAPFCILMGVSAVEGFSGAAAGRSAIAIAVLVAAAILLPPLLAWFARSIIREVQALDREREQLTELYGRARRDALIDGLTGLGNHRAFQDELARQIEIVKRQGTPLALMLVDVDNLKGVNDTQGHAAGDRLLESVGRVTAAVLRRSDRAFRVGGDEFAILLPTTDVEMGLAIARRILAAALTADRGVTKGDVEPFSLSIGVSAYPTPSAEGHHLYRNADAALYWCKRHGRTGAVAFDPGRHGAASDDRSVAELSAAIDTVLQMRALRPVFQPIFSMTTGELIGYEGLVRPAEGAPFSDASSLFAAAEAADKTVELDLTCLGIVAEGARLPERDVYLSVNLSPRTLESNLFHASELKAILQMQRIPLERVVLELTERERVEDLEQLRRNVAACRRAGMRLAADDVGAGNAGLRLLSEIHFDIVKIDLSLVQGGTMHDPSHAVLRALQELANQWKASIVAEGVETAAQLTVVRGLGIAAGQGYLLGRPSGRMDVDALVLDELEVSGELDDLLRRRSARDATGSPSRSTQTAPSTRHRPATARRVGARPRAVDRAV
ncbi:MAG TPA: EAL domain-containing protein [Candidatus Limnocylindrales bacterium]|jgi:diguanylate cyclase (GGDEF)-like protein|nr:EAL domain-containing protein [Candidatus Limnocylindrales bacterium]